MSMPTNQSPGVTALSSYEVMSMVRTLIAQNTLVIAYMGSQIFPEHSANILSRNHDNDDNGPFIFSVASHSDQTLLDMDLYVAPKAPSQENKEKNRMTTLFRLQILSLASTKLNKTCGHIILIPTRTLFHQSRIRMSFSPKDQWFFVSLRVHNSTFLPHHLSNE